MKDLTWPCPTQETIFLPKAIGSQIENPVLVVGHLPSSLWSLEGVPETFEIVEATATVLGTHQNSMVKTLFLKTPHTLVTVRGEI